VYPVNTINALTGSYRNFSLGEYKKSTHCKGDNPRRHPPGDYPRENPAEVTPVDQDFAS